MSFARVTVLVRLAGGSTLSTAASPASTTLGVLSLVTTSSSFAGQICKSRIAIFDLNFDAILSAMYALSVSAEGDCYRCVPPDPGIAAAALGASESSTLPGIAPAEALHTFTLDSGASRCFFRDSTTLTPLPAPVPVRLANPSGGPVVARSSTVLPCPVVPSGSLSGLHLPSFSTNLVSTAALQDVMVTTTTPGGQRVSICTCTRTGRYLTTFTRRPGSSLYTLATEPSQSRERYFLLVVDDYTRYTTVFPLRSKGQRRIGLVMGVARTSMIHAAAPHFLWPFAVQYTAHQLNLWPHVSLPETSPTLRWTREVGDASVFRVWGSRAFVRDTSADKLSPRAIPCVFLGFVPDAPGWQFYHPTSRRVFPSQDVTFDESGPAPSGVSQVDPLPGLAPVQVAYDSGDARGAAFGGAASGGAEPGGAESEGAEIGGAEPGGVETGGAEPGGVATGSGEPEGVEPGGAASEGAESGGAEPQGAASSGGSAGASPSLSPQQLREWFVRRTRLRSGASGAGGACPVGDGGCGVAAGAGVTGGTATTGPGGACTRGTRAAGTGGVEGTGAGDLVESGTTGAGGAGAGGAGVGGPGAGGAGVGGPGVGGAGARGAGAVDPGGAVRPRPYFIPLLQQVLGTPPSAALTPPLLCPPPDQSQPPLQPASPLPAPSPYSEQSGGLTERREPASRPVLPVRTARRSPRLRPPPVPGTHAKALHPLTLVSLPLLSLTLPAAASALVAELLDFAAACRLNYATTLVAESVPANPPSVGGECALGTDVLEDTQEDFECLAAAIPRFASMLLAPEGDPDAPDIPTPRSYAEAITGPYSSQWVKWPPGSPPDFKARYVARGFSQRQGVDYFQTFSPTPKMTTLRVLLHVAAQRDCELHSLDFSTSFLQGSLHEEIWLRRPPGFTESFPAGTQWSLRRPVYGLRQAPREWHDTLRTTLAALGFAPATADPSLFLRTDTSLLPFYVLVYVLQCFGFHFSSPQPTPLSTSHSLSAPPSDESVEPSGPYPELVGCLMYLMTCTRPDLAYTLSLLARYVALGRNRKVHWDAAKRVLHYLCSTSGMGLVLGGRGPVVLTGHADASWVDDSATQQSSQGYTFSLGSGWAMAAQELRWLTYLLTGLGEQPRLPPVLYVDNKAMIALWQEHRFEHRTKHIALRYFLARELQQRGQLRLAYVATRANTADVFTKALPPGDHQRFVTLLGLLALLFLTSLVTTCHRQKLPTEQLHSDRHYGRRHHPYERTTHVAAGVKGGRADAAAAAAGHRQKLPNEQLHRHYNTLNGGAGARDPGAGGPAAGGTGAGGAGATSPGGAGFPTGARVGDSGAGGPGGGGAGAGGTGVGDPRAGGARAGDPRARGAGAGGAGAGGTSAGGTVQRRPFFVPPPPSLLRPPDSTLLQSVVSLSLVLPRLFAFFRTGRCIPRSRPPPVPGTRIMALRPSSVPQRVPLASPPAFSLGDGPNPESDLVRAASPTVPRLLATVVTDPSFESIATSALVADLVDFAVACRLDYAASLVAESGSNCPPSVGGECALGTDVLEDTQEDFECLAAAVPHLVAMLLAPKGDPDAPDIPTPRSYAEAIRGPYSSQWQTAMDAEMASWKSTSTYVDAVPPPRANIVDGMWIFRVKRPPGSPHAFKARYVARGFSEQQEVDFFHTFSPNPKMTTLRVLLHVAAQRDYKLHSLELSTSFLQGSLHEEIWQRRPPGFTGSFPAGTQTTLADLGFAPSTAEPSLFLRTDTSLPPFYVLVYVDDFVFASADTEALALVKLELQKRHTCTDLGELRNYLGLQITWDKARRTITLTQSHMVHQILQRFGFRYSSSQSTPLSHSLSVTRSQLQYFGRVLHLAWGSCLEDGVQLSLLDTQMLLGSSCEAEIYAGAMAAQELCRLTYLLTDFGERPRSPPVLYVDNKAMIALCQEHRLEHRTKHIALGYFLSRELQQRGQLAYVATRANTADILTKALQSGDHQRFVTVLGLVPTLPHLLTA
ncbi:unnamed protein product [Closterium sp. NIES-53]